MSQPTAHTTDTAIQTVLKRIQEKLQEPPDPQFRVHQKTQAVTCTEECMYAGSARIVQIAKTVLEEVRQEDSYQIEKAAAKIVALAEAHQAWSMRAAEVLQLYPAAHTSLTDIWPALHSLHADGEAMWEQIKHSVTAHKD